MATILIPVDFSVNALNAAEHAVRLFGLEGNTYLLVHAYLDPNMMDPAVPSMNEVLRQASEGSMAKFVEDLRARPDLERVELKGTVRLGILPAVLADLVDEHGPRCVVMGTQGASGLKAGLFGSNAADVVQRSTVPVLTVPEESRYREPRRILLADDGGEIRPGTLDLLLDIARWSKAEVMIVRVVAEGTDPEHALASSSYDDLLGGVPHSHHPVSGANVADAISDMADQSDVDLVVMVHRHLGFFASLFHASNSKRMALHTHVPLLILEQ